ncbi:MAG: Na(+)-translocating NADH-quinone reductase subunit A [Tannerella sp.]|jgi:Na+-transporting NADH:ubiquinone oxidoreductase subunit A|nr:Na(+)-translocating NADH-quinone reductase subunit A [Tannerella sp.]
MADVIKIKKGLDINLKGKAPKEFINVCKSENYAIVPDDYTGITPKALVRAGDRVKAGTPLMMDKANPEIKFVSPVSGEVTDVNRGEKRKILSITVKPDVQIEYEQFDTKDWATFDAAGIKDVLLKAGMWAFIRQRPYDRIAKPSDTPRDIFVTAYNSAPLAPDFDFIVEGEEEALKAGLKALSKLTAGNVYLGVKGGSALKDIAEAEAIELYGPHPAGNVGVLINRIKPVNKGDVVWTLTAADVLYIGRLLLSGKADFTRIVGLTGSELSETGYAKVIAGCTIESLVSGKISDAGNHTRIVSGNVLTGKKVGRGDYLGAYDNQITVIPEGDDVDEFVGWATPGFGKYSVSRMYFSWLFGKKKEYVLDARIRGGKRAIIMSNEYDKVFPMDILPEYLLKAIITFDIDKMENLGIYEVAPEDFALCEFVDTSKIEIQKIVRNGLDLLYKEMN